MRWVDFLKHHELMLKSVGIRLTSANKKKLKSAWLNKGPINFDRLFQLEYSETIEYIITTGVNIWGKINGRIT